METQEKSEVTKILEFELTNSCEDWEWEDYLEDIKYIFGGHCYFHVEAENVGWRNLHGYKYLEADPADDPVDFLRQVLGFTRDPAWTVKIKITQEQLDLFHEKDKPAQCLWIVYHHDSPTGETRTVRSMTFDEWLENDEAGNEY